MDWLPSQIKKWVARWLDVNSLKLGWAFVSADQLRCRRRVLCKDWKLLAWPACWQLPYWHCNLLASVHCASKCIALYCTVFHCITPHYTVFYSITLYYIVFHSISLYHTVFHCIPLHFTVLKCIEFLHRALWYPMQCVEVQWPVYSALDQHEAKYHWKVEMKEYWEMIT